MVKCKICGQTRALIEGVCLRCDKIFGDVDADLKAELDLSQYGILE